MDPIAQSAAARIEGSNIKAFLSYLTVLRQCSPVHIKGLLLKKLSICQAYLTTADIR